MSMLSEVPFDQLQVGDKLISAKNNPGVITKLIKKEDTTSKEDNEISMDWESGSKSWGLFHFWCDQITYVGRD